MPAFLKIILFFLMPRWDRKNNPEPWNNIEPNQQYKVGEQFFDIITFLLIKTYHLWYLALTFILPLDLIALCICFCLVVCPLLFISSFSQLTWTTPNWRRTDLIFKSWSCLTIQYDCTILFFCPNTNKLMAVCGWGLCATALIGKWRNFTFICASMKKTLLC